MKLTKELVQRLQNMPDDYKADVSIINKPLNKFIKRAIDIVVSFLFLVTIFPLILLVAAVAIKSTSKGPVFFTQRRTGINGKEFKCYKFRTMVENDKADLLQATENDYRITKVGDFMRRKSIDELPQFINAFLGDMSVVGPRPHMVKHTEEFSEQMQNYNERLRVKPGITGVAQVVGYRGQIRQKRDLVGRVNADIWYINNWSALLDIELIASTFIKVSSDSRAY